MRSETTAGHPCAPALDHLWQVAFPSMLKRRTFGKAGFPLSVGFAWKTAPTCLRLSSTVGIHIVTFEACSGFTHVAAPPIAQSPLGDLVTRLQPLRLPARNHSSRVAKPLGAPLEPLEALDPHGASHIAEHVHRQQPRALTNRAQIHKLADR